MSSADPRKGKKSKEKDWGKIIVSIPKLLLAEFDMVCEAKFYSRPEAIKQAMRYFIEDEMGQDYKSAKMQEYENKLASGTMEAITLGMARAAKKTQQQNLPLGVEGADTVEEIPEGDEHKYGL